MIGYLVLSVILAVTIIGFTTSPTNAQTLKVCLFVSVAVALIFSRWDVTAAIMTGAIGLVFSYMITRLLFRRKIKAADATQAAHDDRLPED